MLSKCGKIEKGRGCAALRTTPWFGYLLKTILPIAL